MRWRGWKLVIPSSFDFRLRPNNILNPIQKRRNSCVNAWFSSAAEPRSIWNNPNDVEDAMRIFMTHLQRTATEFRDKNTWRSFELLKSLPVTIASILKFNKTKIHVQSMSIDFWLTFPFFPPAQIWLPTKSPSKESVALHLFNPTMFSSTFKRCFEASRLNPIWPQPV